MRHFLDQLFTTGDVTVVPPQTVFEMSAGVEAEIRRFDHAARLDMPGEAPELNLPVATWAARILAESARLAIARDLGPEHVAKVLSQRCPDPRSAEVDYSADLFLRYLPDLVRLVERLAMEDPLVVHLRRLAGEWPLSSVGLNSLSIASVDPFMEHPGLRQLYVDRVLSAGDVSRLADPRVALAVRASLGAHPELAPGIAREVGLVAGTP